MKKFILLITVVFGLNLLSAQPSLVGAWQWETEGESGQNIQCVVIIDDKFQSVACFDSETGEFHSTNGGRWAIEGQTITEVVEFDSSHPERVGEEVVFEIVWDGPNRIRMPDDLLMERIDDGQPGALSGAWLMSGRKRDGEIQQRDTDRPRKTMKILSGTRFQWIAYNTETRQFMATGGGTYTTEDGIYTEHIEFFSRDVARVGASLPFNYQLRQGKWHHSGKSSKGDPLFEIWSPRER